MTSAKFRYLLWVKVTSKEMSGTFFLYFILMFCKWSTQLATWWKSKHDPSDQGTFFKLFFICLDHFFFVCPYPIVWIIDILRTLHKPTLTQMCNHRDLADIDQIFRFGFFSSSAHKHKKWLLTSLLMFPNPLTGITGMSQCYWFHLSVILNCGW